MVVSCSDHTDVQRVYVSCSDHTHAIARTYYLYILFFFLFYCSIPFGIIALRTFKSQYVKMHFFFKNFLSVRLERSVRFKIRHRTRV